MLFRYSTFVIRRFPTIHFIEEDDGDINRYRRLHMKKIHRNLSLEIFFEYLIYFFLYSVLGWIYEVVLEVFIYRWGFSNRGALFGPYCVIYGFGALIFLILLKDLKSRRIGTKKLNLTPLLVFFAIIFIATVVELIGSYIMEATQGGWMWDYSDYFANFQGRIALNPSIRFGIGGMVILYLLQPLFEKGVKKLSGKTVILTGGIIGAILLVDFLHLLLF